MTERTIARCPCGSGTIEIVTCFFDDIAEVKCSACGRTTGEHETQEAAHKAWNARTAEELEQKK